MSHGVIKRDSLLRVIAEHLLDKIDSHGVGFDGELGLVYIITDRSLEHSRIVPSVPFNSWELLVLIVRCHSCDLVFLWGSQLFNHTNELSMRSFTFENWFSRNQLSDDASNGPDINLMVVLCISKNKLRRSIISGRDICHTCIVFFIFL